MARERLFWGFEPWLRTPFLGGLSHGSRPINYCIWAMAQEHLFWRCWSCALHCSGKNFRFYLTSLFWVRLGKNMVFLSHGSNPKIDGSWAMAQTPQKWGPEPWLKPPKKVLPSHGSNPPKMGSRAMAQTPKKGVPEPWLKLDFVLHIFTWIWDDHVIRLRPGTLSQCPLHHWTWKSFELFENSVKGQIRC